MVNFLADSNKSLVPSKLFKTFELVFVFASFFVFSRAILLLVVTGGASEGDGSDLGAYNYSIINGLLILIYLVTFALLALRWKKVLAVISKDRYISIYLGLIIVSFVWSEFPVNTLKYAFSGFGATCFGLYVATRYSPKEQIKLLFWTFAAMLILSVIFAIAIPHYGLEGGVHAGAVRGIFGHKNGFGQTMVLGTLIFLISALDRKNSNNWFAWVCFGGSIALILLCRSGTALLGITIMLILFFIYRIFRARYEILVSSFLFFTIVGLISITWISNNEDAVFAAIGEDATLTGRTEIWQYVWHMIQQRPWLGYGYKGFWHYLDGPSAYVNLAFGPYGGGAGVPHSHNGFLEIVLAIGVVGLSVFLIGFAINLIKAITLVRFNKDMETFWPLLYLTYTVVANLVESPLSGFDNLLWVLYATTIFSLTISPSNTNLAKKL